MNTSTHQDDGRARIVSHVDTRCNTDAPTDTRAAKRGAPLDTHSERIHLQAENAAIRAEIARIEAEIARLERENAAMERFDAWTTRLYAARHLTPQQKVALWNWMYERQRRQWDTPQDIAQDRQECEGGEA